MAGMLSMLRNSQVKMDIDLRSRGGSSHFPERNTLRSQSSIKQKKSALPRSYGLILTSSDLPKIYRKNREIHPLLRRSICTLILSVVSLLVGVAVFIPGQFNITGEKVSIIGLVFLIFGGVLMVGGVIWLFWSQRKLDKIEREMEKRRKSQLLKNIKYASTFTFSPRTESNMNKSIKFYPSTKWPRKLVNENHDIITDDVNMRTNLIEKREIIKESCDSSKKDVRVLLQRQKSLSEPFINNFPMYDCTNISKEVSV